VVFNRWFFGERDDERNTRNKCLDGCFSGVSNSAVVKNTVFPVFCMGNKILSNDFYDDKLRRIPYIY